MISLEALLASYSQPPTSQPPTSQPTPAQALFRFLVNERYLRTGREFADVVETNVGNIYNYLADYGLRRRIPATTETLRRWGRAIERWTEDRVRVQVTVDAEGTVEVTVGGVSSDGRPVTSVRAVAESRPSHESGSEVGQRACDEILNAIKAFRPEASRQCTTRNCLIRAGRTLLRIEHGRHELGVRVGLDAAATRSCREAFEHGGIPIREDETRPAQASGQRVLVLVGDGHVEPGRFAFALADSIGWLPPEPPGGETLAEELRGSFTEGNATIIKVNRHERNPKARRACIAHFGPRCKACGLVYAERYGLGHGFIHVHHVKPISTADGPYTVDPLRDLVPVCANCHSMLHWARTEPRTVEELKALLAKMAQRNAPGEASRKPTDRVDAWIPATPAP